MLPAAVPASQHGLGGENTARGVAYLQGGNGEKHHPKACSFFFLGFPDAADARYTTGDGVRELPPRSLCPHCVLCQMAAPVGKVSSFFDMCLYAGDAFSFLKISFLARRRKGKTISKK